MYKCLCVKKTNRSDIFPAKMANFLIDILSLNVILFKKVFDYIFFINLLMCFIVEPIT